MYREVITWQFRPLPVWGVSQAETTGMTSPLAWLAALTAVEISLFVTLGRRRLAGWLAAMCGAYPMAPAAAGSPGLTMGRRAETGARVGRAAGFGVVARIARDFFRGTYGDRSVLEAP